MALTADQQATLQLLLERGQSYADLASLLGTDEDEVRARARSALRELAGADPDRNVGLTDYLLGQADPIGRADVVRHLRDNPDDHSLASHLISELRRVVPGAELPRLPGEPRPGRFRRAPQVPAEEGEAPVGGVPGTGRLPTPSGSQSRLLIALGSGAILLIAVVLAVTGAFGGDDDGDDTAATAATMTTDGDSNAAVDEIARVPLAASGGGNAEGQAIFGLATDDQAYVDVSITGLDPPPNGQSYVIWLLLDKQRGYPLSPINVSENGSFQNRFAIPSAVLAVVANTRFVDVSIAPNQQLADLISEAEQRVQRPNAQVADLILSKPGHTVLSGEIPAAEGGGAGAGAQG
jgi:hypothetical protein